MRKSANEQTNTVVNATRTKNLDTDRREKRNQPRSAVWQPSSWPFRSEDVNPLGWWRTMPADLLRDAEHLALRETIRKVGVLKGCEWVAAMRGDVPAGIAIALEALPITTITIEVDIAMTTLMLVALEGNAASALVLSQVLLRTSLDHPFAKELSVSWLVLNLHRAIGKTKRLVKGRSRGDGEDQREVAAQTIAMGA